MTSRERVVTAMRRQEPDRVPFDFLLGYTPYQANELRRRTGSADFNEYFQTDARCVGIGPTRLRTDFARYFEDLPPRAWLDEWGIGHLPTESDNPRHAHLEGFLYPLANRSDPQDARDYPLPDLEAEYRYERLPQQITELHARGLAVVGGMACTLFENLWQIRSMEGLLTDFVDNPEFAASLLDRLLSKREVQARRFAEMGADVIMTGDDVSTQRGMLMSAAMWRRWFKPRLARVIAAAKNARLDVLIFYHSDGNPAEIIPDLIEIGVDILNPVQPECMNTAEVKRLYGDRLSFWGAIGTQSNLPWGTPEDVRREVRERIETMGAGGGLMLAPTHTIEPEVPWENIVAYVEAAREYGRYG
jgi:uroporphyrinogen decarboxylase